MDDEILNHMHDHFLVQYILGRLVNQVCECEMVEQNSIDEMEEYPFVTFKWIVLDQPTTTDWLGKYRQYLCTLQIDVHATTSTQSIKLARKLYEALHTDAYRRYFLQAHILPQDITNTSDRTALAGINYDQDYGFDCSFLVTSGFVYAEKDLDFTYSDADIRSIKADEKIYGSDIKASVNVSKEEKEE